MKTSYIHNSLRSKYERSFAILNPISPITYCPIDVSRYYQFSSYNTMIFRFIHTHFSVESFQQINGINAVRKPRTIKSISGGKPRFFANFRDDFETENKGTIRNINPRLNVARSTWSTSFICGLVGPENYRLRTHFCGSTNVFTTRNSHLFLTENNKSDKRMQPENSGRDSLRSAPILTHKYP